MPRKTPGNYVPLDVNYIRDGAIRRAGEAAELLYIRALAYSKGSRTAGFIPDYDIDVIAVGMKGTPGRVAALVCERLWIDTPGGYRVRSWERWNGEDDGHVQAGAKGNHIRWHVNGGRPDPDCDLCSDSQSESGGESHSDPPASPEGSPLGVSQGKGREGKGTSSDDTSQRADVEALCDRLADHIEANGSKRPKVTATWRTECRRMLDVDGREPDRAGHLIDWCQADPFWRANVLSMPTFRAKYEQLRLKATAEWESKRVGLSPSGQVDPDAILGRDLWQLPSPPDGVEPGTAEFSEWAKAQRAGRKAERESEARGVVERRRGA